MLPVILSKMQQFILQWKKLKREEIVISGNLFEEPLVFPPPTYSELCQLLWQFEPTGALARNKVRVETRI